MVPMEGVAATSVSAGHVHRDDARLAGWLRGSPYGQVGDAPLHCSHACLEHNFAVHGCRRAPLGFTVLMAPVSASVRFARRSKLTTLEKFSFTIFEPAVQELGSRR